MSGPLMTRRGLLSLLPAVGVMPETMTVARPDGRLGEIVFGCTVGSFFIHRSAGREDNPWCPEWTVSHKGTGARVWWFDGRGDAVQFAKDIEPLGPWGEIRSAANLSPEWQVIGRSVRAIIDGRSGHGGGSRMTPGPGPT